MSNRTEENGPHYPLDIERNSRCEHVEEGDSKTTGDRQGTELSQNGELETNNRFSTDNKSDKDLSLVDKMRLVLDKRRNEIHARSHERLYGPQGEIRSQVITQRVEMIPVELVVDDPDFQNLRPITFDDDILELTESIKFEGLKVPITVITKSSEDKNFYVRAGFRRIKVIRNLGWKKVPAVVLPYDTPIIDEYWTNILENSARSKLSTYEIANAAKVMREKFKVNTREFSSKAGYSEHYVINLLRCIDRLPEEIIKEWRNRAPIPTSLLIDWSKLEHSEAIKMMLTYKNRNERVTKGWAPSKETKEKVKIIRMASPTGLQRMQRARFAVEVCRALDPKTRELCLKIIDFCTGARNDIPGVHDPKAKKRMYKSRRREDLEGSEIIECIESPETN